MSVEMNNSRRYKKGEDSSGDGKGASQKDEGESHLVEAVSCESKALY